MKKFYTKKMINKIMFNINENLQNKDLYEYIISKLDLATTKECKKINILKNGLYIVYKNGDSFEITFEPNISNFSKIETNYSCWNNHHEEHKEIEFNNEKITITEFETTHVFKNKKPSCIMHKINKHDFINNELAHKYSYECETNFDREKKNSGCTEEVIYVLPDKRAAKSISIIGESNYFGNKGTCYCKTNYCDEANFDTRKQNKGIYSYGMSTCSKEDFDYFIDEWKKEYKDKIKEKI